MCSTASRFLRCACTATGFAVAAAALHWAFPPQVEEVTPKLDFLASHAIERVFIGSSRIYHGISPEVFDAALAQAGLPGHSFNLGVDAMRPPESLLMARKLVALRSVRLRTVFLELATYRGEPHELLPSARDVYWHDGRALWFAWQQARRDLHAGKAGKRWAHAWRDFGNGLALFARNESSAGRFAPAPEFGSGESADSALGPAGDGYLPMAHIIAPADRQRLAEAVVEGSGKAQAAPEMSDLNRLGYAEIRDLLKQHGIDLILVTTPTTREPGAALDRPEGVPLLAFDDPKLHPKLFEPGHRVDYDHLNGDGARIFSKEVAAAYLRLASGARP